MTDPSPSQADSGAERPAARIDRRSLLLAGTPLAASMAGAAPVPTLARQPAPAPQPAPVRARPGPSVNILVMFGDDVGQSNVSAYTLGLMFPT